MPKNEGSANGNGPPPQDNNNGEWFFKGDGYDEKDSVRQLYRKLLNVLHKVGSSFGQVNLIVKEFAAFREDFLDHKQRFDEFQAENLAFRNSVVKAINPLLKEIGTLQANFNQETNSLRDSMSGEAAALGELAKKVKGYKDVLETHTDTVENFREEVELLTRKVVKEGVPAKLGELPATWLTAIDTKLAPVEQEQTKLIKHLISHNAGLEKRLKLTSIVMIASLIISALSLFGVCYLLVSKSSANFAAASVQVEKPQPDSQEQSTEPSALQPAPAQAEAPKKSATKPAPYWLRKKANKD